jgi:hypothetical protein
MAHGSIPFRGTRGASRNVKYGGPRAALAGVRPVAGNLTVGARLDEWLWAQARR